MVAQFDTDSMPDFFVQEIDEKHLNGREWTAIMLEREDRASLRVNVKKFLSNRTGLDLVHGELIAYKKAG